MITCLLMMISVLVLLGGVYKMALLAGITSVSHVCTAPRALVSWLGL